MRVLSLIAFSLKLVGKESRNDSNLHLGVAAVINSGLAGGVSW